jgi:hypothetical protein
VSSLQLAAAGIEPLVLRVHRHAGAALRGLRYVMEYVFYQGVLSRLWSSVAMDILPSM